MSDITPIGSHPRAKLDLMRVSGTKARTVMTEVFGFRVDTDQPILFRVMRSRTRYRSWECWAWQGGYGRNISIEGRMPPMATREDAESWARAWADEHGIPYQPKVVTQTEYGPPLRTQAPLAVGHTWWKWRETWSNEHHRYMAEVQQVATIEAIDGAEVVVRYESGRKGRLCVTKFGRSGPWRIAPPGARRGTFELKPARPVLRLVP